MLIQFAKFGFSTRDELSRLPSIVAPKYTKRYNSYKKGKINKIFTCTIDVLNVAAADLFFFLFQAFFLSFKRVFFKMKALHEEETTKNLKSRKPFWRANENTHHWLVAVNHVTYDERF